MSSIQFDPEAVRSLANILRDAGLTEIEIVDADRRIRVVRAPAPVTAPAAALATVPVAAAPQPAEPAPSQDEVPPAGAVTSPMVGVAFLTPDPASPPFVTQGQAVAAGQTVMLIEAMKTFNQIKAPRAGTVGRILVANSSPVEYGEVLMLIDP